MNPLKEHIAEVFPARYPDIQARIEEEGKGLTLRQSKTLLYMLQLLQERETALRGELRESLKLVVEAKQDQADEKQQWARLVAEWNALTDGLSALFHLEVYSNALDAEKRSLWTVEYPGGKLAGFATMAEAFLAGIQECMKAGIPVTSTEQE